MLAVVGGRIGGVTWSVAADGEGDAPGLVLLDSDGHVLVRVNGLIGPEEFTRKLEEAEAARRGRGKTASAD